MSAPPSGDVVGLDVGATSLHGVRLDGLRRLTSARVFAADDVDAVVAWAAGAAVAAIDGPDGPSRGAHRDDLGVGRKFRGGRTSEVALGRHHGHWVSWVTPEELPPGTWMARAAELHAALAAAGAEPLEVYPHAAFRELAGGARLPSKRTAAGVAARVAVLRDAGADAPHLELWSHDGLDAYVAALVAADRVDGRAVAAAPRAGDPPGDDGSRIWLPARPAG